MKCPVLFTMKYIKAQLMSIFSNTNQDITSKYMQTFLYKYKTWFIFRSPAWATTNTFVCDTI